jgi:hypothetical protein
MQSGKAGDPAVDLWGGSSEEHSGAQPEAMQPQKVTGGHLVIVNLKSNLVNNSKTKKEPAPKPCRSWK